jgi:hypothetical protein
MPLATRSRGRTRKKVFASILGLAAVPRARPTTRTSRGSLHSHDLSFTLADFFPICIPLFLGLRQALDDALCKMLVNLTVPRYRFGGSSFWIVIDIVFLPMS